MRRSSEAARYALFGGLFGLLFPVFSIFSLYVAGELDDTHSMVGIIRSAHTNILLHLVDTAPLFLGFFAWQAGKRQDRIQRFAEDLEAQVREKTELLRIALDDARDANSTIAHLADHDALTGLLNRRSFQKNLDDWIKYAWRYERKGTLMFIDLDNFKQINDMHGHGTGDEYLVACADLLTHSLRSTDTISRWGGDEFAVFLPEAAGRDAEAAANKLLAAFSQAYAAGGQSIPVSVSIGLAHVPESSLSCLELIASADEAMYEAKRAGKNCWRLYTPSSCEARQ